MLGMNTENITSSFKMIEGPQSVIVREGRADFSTIKFFAEPNSEVFFKVTADTISRYFTEYFPTNDNLTNSNLVNIYAYIFSIKFRDCIKGEIFKSQINRFSKIVFFNDFFFSCSRCKSGRYSLTDPKNSSDCKTCPPTSVCLGGAEISLNKGY